MKGNCDNLSGSSTPMKYLCKELGESSGIIQRMGLNRVAKGCAM